MHKTFHVFCLNQLSPKVLHVNILHLLFSHDTNILMVRAPSVRKVAWATGKRGRRTKAEAISWCLVNNRGKFNWWSVTETLLHLCTRSAMGDCAFHFELDLNPKCSSAGFVCQWSLNKPLINFRSFSLASFDEYRSRLLVRWWHPHFIQASCFLPLPCLQVLVPWGVLDSSSDLQNPSASHLQNPRLSSYRNIQNALFAPGVLRNCFSLPL